MQYQCGMYGGSFNPPHLGHVKCIIEAANRCKSLVVVISEGVNRNEIDVKIRYRWIYQLTKHLGAVRIMILRDTAETKEAYDETMWRRDAARVKQFAGETIDAVFCGSDYGTDSFWAKCYPGAALHLIARDGVSSTGIRGDIYGNWHNLPAVVRPYYVKKVLLTGGESTGKSTLTINLAHYYNTNYLEEVGRELSERSGTDRMMIPSDFTDILLQHKLREREAIQSSNRVLFIDTDCLVTEFYIRFLKDAGAPANTALADAIARVNHYDLILFLEPDVRFVQDGDRSEVIAADREGYSNKIKELYRSHGFQFEEIRGTYQERFEQAVRRIDLLFQAEGSNGSA